MSNLTVKGNASGTGTVILEAPNTNSNRTITLPDAATTLVGTDATQTLTNKTIDGSQLTGTVAASLLTGNVAAARITDALNASGSAPIYACRAWVNFNGTGTVAIRASGNVSSITDNGAGDYTVNFTTAMPDANYAVIGSADYSGTASTPVFNYSIVSSSSVRTQTKNGPTGNAIDNPSVSVSIFR